MPGQASYPRIYLQPGGDRRLAEGRPWVFANEIRMDAAAKALPAGALVALSRVDGKPLGVGSFNPHSLISFRLFDCDPRQSIDTAFLAARLRRALALRELLFEQPYYRLAHAEGDGLPGLIADRFGDTLVLQLNTAGMELLKDDLLAAVDQVLSPASVLLRNDQKGRALEGLPAEVILAKGNIDEPLSIPEGGCRFLADLRHGQKTGWFYDQREARLSVAPLARGGAALDAYCHTGGFAVLAAAAGATRVLGIDASEPALALARQAAAVNTVADRCQFRRNDVFDALTALADAGERFRLVVADPPAFVKSRKDLAGGLRAYRKLARLAATLIEAGGFMFIATCSHNVETNAFIAEVARGVTAAGRQGRILRQAGAAPDHPVHPHLPETAYLKSLLLQLD